MLKKIIICGCIALGLQSNPAFAVTEVVSGIPASLSAKDVQTYKKMFTYQRALKRKDAAAEIKNLSNKKLLMGHVVAARLLHPKTRSSYQDLKTWLARYHDHPQAWQIYKLAKKRAPKGAGLRKPSISRGASIAQYGDVDALHTPTSRAKPSAQRTKKLKELRKYRQRKQYTRAVKQLNRPYVKRLLGAETYFNVGLRLAQQMLNEGVFDKAISLVDQLIKIADFKHPKALWVKGLAYYQKGYFDLAGGSFREMVETLSTKRSRYYTKATYWAGRSYDKLGRRSMAKVFYTMAAQQPLSFYGMLASEKLGKKPDLDWKAPAIQEKHKKKIFADVGIRRAVALAQIGEHEMAQREFKAAYRRLPYGYDESLLAVALGLRLPSVAMTLARNLWERGQIYLAGLYPEPVWRPLQGFKVDRALLFSIARQESAFIPSVRSRAGARGLMQLMPATAKHIRDIQRRKRFSREELYTPAVSLQLGQDYLLKLDNDLDSNLIEMIAAYNAGPHNVQKWRKRGLNNHDPVLFIEKIPFSETRKYVKVVLANLWFYREKMYEQAPTRNIIIADEWPRRSVVYAALKNAQTQ